jgi:hypothetical protein
VGLHHSSCGRCQEAYSSRCQQYRSNSMCQLG